MGNRTVEQARRRAMPLDRPLALAAALMVPVLAGCLLGLALDDRHLGGAPIWLKPLKFAVSILLYAGTWAWLVPMLPPTRRVRRAAGAIAAVLVLEMALIAAQAARGHASHFNFTTPLDAAVYTVMGASITVLATMSIVLAAVVLRHRFADPATAVALRHGAALSLAGILSAVLMVLPRPGQVDAAMHGGAADRVLGAHEVGVPDGGRTLPLTGWSADGGDLRVPHFVGMHALQVLPLLALALALLAAVVPVLRDVERRARLLRIAALGYGGLFATTLVQALRGRSVADPDLLTVELLTGLAGLTLGLAIAELTHPAKERR